MSGSDKNWIDRFIVRLTRFCVRRPFLVLLPSVLATALSFVYASGLPIRGDFVQLLPDESPAARRFLQAIERRGTAASTLIVLVESPDPDSNRRYISRLEAELRKQPLAGVSGIFHGPGELAEFYRRHRWLFLSTAELERIDCELAREVARHKPGYLELDDDCPRLPSEAQAPVTGGGKTLSRLQSEVDKRVRALNRFPTGYYRTGDGTSYALLIRAKTRGMGEVSADRLNRTVQSIANSVEHSGLHPGTRIGFAGDIPNAIAEREALLDDITIVSSAAIALILLSILVFFRTPFALVHIGFSVALGSAVAFVVARSVYGHLNAATSFLMAIIVGNGINPAIIYLDRYRKRARSGLDIEAALVDAAVSCRRSTWLAALCAGSAYLALLVTSFRGFSEFGLIGGSGMIACWAAAFVVCPASVAAGARIRGALRLAACPTRVLERPNLLGRVTGLVTRFPVPVLVASALVGAAAAIPLPGYFQDPWEYNFAKLTSESSARAGAGHFSKRANAVFGGRGAPQLVMVDEHRQAPLVAAEILERDREVYADRLVRRVETIYDYLGGTLAEVSEKLDLLADIRRSVDEALPHLEGEEREFAVTWRPPERLAPLSAADLPEPILEQFREQDGRIGTPVYVHLEPDVSLSRGENLLEISELLESIRLSSGQSPPTASRATVFAEMIRSMERDGPRATAAAFLVVSLLTVIVTRNALAVFSVLGALIIGVLWTVGGAAWLGVRLNFLNFVALPLTFGIGIEYAINLFDRVRRSEFDVARGVSSIGGAVTLCSLTTIFGYAALIFADNRALQSFGKYAIAGELACLIAALIVMPALLTLWRRQRARVLTENGITRRSRNGEADDRRPGCQLSDSEHQPEAGLAQHPVEHVELRADSA